MAKSKGLACPDCGCKHLLVQNTINRRGRVRRYRICRHCGKRVKSEEVLIEDVEG